MVQQLMVIVASPGVGRLEDPGKRIAMARIRRVHKAAALSTGFISKLNEPLMMKFVYLTLSKYVSSLRWSLSRNLTSHDGRPSIHRRAFTRRRSKIWATFMPIIRTWVLIS